MTSEDHMTCSGSGLKDHPQHQPMGCSANGPLSQWANTATQPMMKPLKDAWLRPDGASLSRETQEEQEEEETQEEQEKEHENVEDKEEEEER